MFLKPYLVNLISKYSHLVFSITIIGAVKQVALNVKKCDYFLIYRLTHLSRMKFSNLINWTGPFMLKQGSHGQGKVSEK